MMMSSLYVALDDNDSNVLARSLARLLASKALAKCSQLTKLDSDDAYDDDDGEGLSLVSALIYLILLPITRDVCRHARSLFRGSTAATAASAAPAAGAALM